MLEHHSMGEIIQMAGQAEALRQRLVNLGATPDFQSKITQLQNERTRLQQLLANIESEHNKLQRQLASLEADNNALRQRLAVAERETAERDRQSATLRPPEKLTGKGGYDRAPCWPAVNRRQAALFRIVVEEDGLTIHPAWPDDLTREVNALPFARDLLGVKLSRSRFSTGFRDLDHATRSDACVHFAEIVDSWQGRAGFQNRQAVEAIFYALRRGS
jgi:hypothetical protein